MVHIAVVGCSHGEIDTIYDHIHHIENERQIKVDLVLCSGDFQSVRNMTDLRCMNCPIKYQAMHDFYRYYSGEKVAPILTIFIGGNHEASNFLQELPFGGWVAPNIYFLGYANILKFGSLRIAGISGIFKGQDYLKGRYECPPYDQNTIRSTYHYRNLDIFRLKQVQSHVDIALSHDWPRGIYYFGNVDELLRRKPFFRDEVQRNELGSRPLHEVLLHLEPSYWFSAHLHVSFYATVPHQSNKTSEGEPSEVKTTKFLALDKVLPRRHYLEVVEIPMTDKDSESDDLHLSYDPEWLAILKLTNHLNNAKPKPCFMPGPGCGARFEFTPSQEEIEAVNKLFKNEFQVPNNFIQTGPVFQQGQKPTTAYPIENPQTVEFCEKLGVTDPISLCTDRRLNQSSNQSNNSSFIEANSSSSFSSTFQEYSPINVSSRPSLNANSFTQNTSADTTNPEEIPLDLDDDDDLQDSNGKDMPSASRAKLLLPPPKSASTPCSRSQAPDEKQDEEEVTSERDPDRALEVKLLESIFQTTNESERQDRQTTAAARNVPDLFVIDRTGAGAAPVPETEPDLKRRRNEELFKALEDEDF